MFEKIAENAFVLYSPNSGSNSFLLLGEKKALIDPGIEQNTQYLVESLASLGVSPKEIDFLIFSHGHSDHFSASQPFSNAESFMHSPDSGKVSDKDADFTVSSLFGTSFFPKISVSLSRKRKLAISPFFLEVIPSPGHTSGSVCFLEKNLGLLFSGDTLFYGSRGRDDLPSGSPLELEKSISSLLKIDFDLLLPGHGLVLRGEQEKNIKTALKTFGSAYL